MNQSKKYLGIDISKESLEIAALEPAEEWSVGNGASGYARLIGALAHWPGAVVVCEASGGYERPLIAARQKAGVAVALVNARQVRDYARVGGQSRASFRQIRFSQEETQRIEGLPASHHRSAYPVSQRRRRSHLSALELLS